MNPATIDRVHAEWVIPIAHALVSKGSPVDTKVRDRFWIVFAASGHGIAEAGGKRLAFSAPALFCLNEEEGFELVESRDLELRIISFHPGFVNSGFDFGNIRRGGEGFTVSASQDLFWFAPFLNRQGPDPSRSGFLETGPLAARKLAQLFGSIESQIDLQPESWPCRCRSYLIELLFLLQRVFAEPEEGSLPQVAEGSGMADKAILYLHGSIDRKLTIRELASALNTNRTTLMAEFRRATGTSVKDYLIGIRMRFAASLIRDTTLPLSEISERAGFSDLPHFSRTFRERMGSSPSEYRQRNCWMLALYPDFRD